MPGREVIAADQKATPLNFWGTGTLDIGARWSRLRDELGIALQFEDNNNDPGPVIAKLVSGGEAKTRHISGLQGGAEKELANRGALLPWDESRLPSLGRMWTWARDIPYVRVNGVRYGIPTVVNADSMIYLPERLGRVDSYSAVFDPKLAGKTSMEDAWINSVIFTAIYLKENHLQAIGDPGNLTETELRGVMAFLNDKAKAGQFRKLWSGWKDGVDLIVSKQVWVMTGWEPIVYEARRQGVQAEYAVPREGYEGWSNDLLLHPGAQKDGVVDLAHKLVEWELSGFYGCSLLDMRGYVVPTDSTVEYATRHPEDFQPPKIKAAVDGVKKKFFEMKGKVYWQNVRPDNYRLYEELWANFRSLF